MTEPLRLSFDIVCSTEHAFAVWTAKIAMWWPLDHTVSGEDGVDVVLEPGAGGRIYDAYAGRSRARLGRGHRLGTADATDVEIRFVDQGDGGTRVEIEHSGWERLGAAGEDWRDRNRAGWQTLMPHYLAALLLP